MTFFFIEFCFPHHRAGWITESLELDVSRLIKLNPRFAESKSIPAELAKEEVGFISTFRLNGLDVLFK